MIKLLDCTLREAPIDKMLLGEYLRGSIFKGLVSANVDIIECGYLKNEKHIKGSTIFQRVEEIEQILANKNSEKLYVALVDYGRYDLNNLSVYSGKSIDGIRICFKKGEQKQVILYAEEIIKKGYKVFIQHVDTLNYTDLELLEFIKDINELKPYAYSIVDTFGSMYIDDIQRIAALVEYNLDKHIKLGFHGHNNLLMANANAQAFICMMYHKRDIIIDSSILGCGRGAGNANTELLIQYLNEKFSSHYDLNEVLDLIDGVVPSIKRKCEWGYSMPYVLSGFHSSHVFNVNYLLKKHNLKLVDLRSILDKLDSKQKKIYDYELLDKLYMEHFGAEVDDDEAIEYVQGFVNQTVLILAPGKTLQGNSCEIKQFIKLHKPIIISLNGNMAGYEENIIFFSSCNRYDAYMKKDDFLKKSKSKKIITSNIKKKADKGEYIIDFKSVAKPGWFNYDSSAILLLRLLIKQGCKKIYIAGMDGFKYNNAENYYSSEYITEVLPKDLELLNNEIRDMLIDIKNTILNRNVTISFITESNYSDIFKEI